MRLFSLCLALACSDKGPTTTPYDTQDSSEPEETGDSGPQGTDDDGDGWTVEDGDCDDTTIYVNPAWDENPDDGIDNDCDGRIDEVWTGFTVAWLDTNTGGGDLLTIDTLGQREDTVSMDTSCNPYSLVPGLEGALVFNDGGSALAVMDASGSCADLADYSESDFGLSDVGASPLGYYLALSPDALTAVSEDGTTATLASWSADYTDPDTFERYAVAMAVDIRDGTVGFGDYFGGFYTWGPEDGLVEWIAPDLDNPLFAYADLAARDGGGWVALGTDTTTGVYGVYDLDGEPGAATWTLRAAWEDSTRSPYALTTEGGTQDTYVVTNGGQRGRVWRVRYENGEQSSLYETDDDPYRYFTGLVTNYQ